jgi:hypothetical protein
MDSDNYGVIEGVIVPRALRKWLAIHSEGKPADEVILLQSPKVPISANQARMAKGCDTVWREIEPELVKRGVKIRKV